MKVKVGDILVDGNRAVKIIGPISDIGLWWAWLIAHRYKLHDVEVINGNPVMKYNLKRVLQGYEKPNKKELAKIKLLLDW